MAHRVKVWCKHHPGLLANLFAVLAVVLLGVVCIQAWMLHSRGWRIALGTVPEWGSAAFTGIAALGVLAAFDNLRIVRRQWESQLANQATLIIVEPVPAPPPPFGSEAKPRDRYVVIQNHSTEPVFNLRIDRRSPKPRDKFGTHFEERVPTTDGSIRHTAPPNLVPVLSPRGATAEIRAQSLPMTETPTEYVSFTFTDARGAGWRRLGSEQPVPIKRDPEQ
ncbi:MAG TPA: hypothetical protein VLL82_16225 [Mycobacterium sp.]|nr:hypothetical protein [Mycobacterium sp.]